MSEQRPASERSPVAEPPAARTRLRWMVRGGIILLVLGLSVWYVVGNVDWGGLQRALLAMHPVWIIGGVLATLGAHTARAQRWRVLIPNGSSISLMNSFSATIVGYLMNNIIPRSGELVRPYTLARRENRPATSLLATILVERVLDGLTLACIFVLLLFTESRRLDQIFTGYSPSDIVTSLFIPIAIVIVGIVLILKTTLGERLIGPLERLLPAKFRGRLGGFLHDFRTGIGFGGIGGILQIILWTGFIWLGYVLSVYCGIYAFGFDTAYGMGMGDALVILAITAVGVTIAPTPGAFGVYHTFCKAALVALFGVTPEAAVAFALSTHAAQYLAVMIVGPFFLLRENLSLREMSRPSVPTGSEGDMVAPVQPPIRPNTPEKR